MDEWKAIDLICRLPEERSVHSPLELVTRAGFSTKKAPSIDFIKKWIQENPEYVEVWLKWSDDKRSFPSWYFERSGESYKVAFYPNGEELRFFDPYEACANFILLDICSIAQGIDG